MNFRISLAGNLSTYFTFIRVQMRAYIFLCLMCWARSADFSLSSKATPVSRNLLEKKASNRPCLEFSQLSVKDSFKDLFNPRIEMFLMLYTRKNLNCAESLLEQNSSLNMNFDINKKTVWLIHGYRPMGSTPSWLKNFLRILLNQDDINIIVVDWNRGATTLIYNRAVKNTKKVALLLSKCIHNLLKHGASLDNFHFIGVSLGAHISGFVGKLFQGQLGRITGLDPAGPKFSGKPSMDRLDYTDAKFVDIIHSDVNGLGINEPLGHIDFYPNGGKKQPGCPKTIFSGIEFIKCDHQRAVYLFMATLETKCNFISFPCASYNDYKIGLCMDCEGFSDGFKKKSCPKLGYQAELWKDILIEKRERSLRTTVFLDTTGTKPFCTYYFVLSIIVLNKTMKDGYIKFKLLNQLGMVEEPRLYEKSTSFYKFQEVKVLAQFLNDVNISRIGLTYFQSSNHLCFTCGYNIHRLMLKSLTYPERPPLCNYNFLLKESEEVFLSPSTCKPQEI
ncbi:lipase member I isoform X1 [Erinaceus europaeus]|uniref:Lipase member I isoform X1 n=1 Tax=Erinaceus europaeus TaxID=9365 RepID=A0ABM3VUW3_ERIEU|nr:lipase member I isoform X1 [Erinaceus europaeus]